MVLPVYQVADGLDAEVAGEFGGVGVPEPVADQMERTASRMRTASSGEQTVKFVPHLSV